MLIQQCWCSGFTLDKESNTIAIICQDVTVVLAFDTRERLIQWQVKIANHLGQGKTMCNWYRNNYYNKCMGLLYKTAPAAMCVLGSVSEFKRTFTLLISKLTLK